MSWRQWFSKRALCKSRPRSNVRNGASNAMITIIFYAAFFYEGTAQTSGGFRQNYLQEWPTSEPGPYFDTTTEPSNYTALVGKTAHLQCVVRNLGNQTVSWIRHRDTHLLTTGRYTYTSDQRFEALHAPHTNEWTLRIKFAQNRDSGTYECQISTTPPIGHLIHLTVIEPITEIAGGEELFIDKGSTINLTCLVRNSPEPPATMIWSHNSRPINFDSPRGGISLITEKGPVTTSRLLIQKAIQEDSGMYTCAPSNAHSKNIRVHILNEEHPAAMHHGAGDRMAGRLLPVVLLLRLIF